MPAHDASTPGYIREEVNFKPAPSQRVGGLILGSGVQVDGIVQKIDTFLESRLRGSTSDRVSSETQEQTYQQLEGLIGELGDNGLSSSIRRVDLLRGCFRLVSISRSTTIDDRSDASESGPSSSPTMPETAIPIPRQLTLACSWNCTKRFAA